MVPLDSGGIEQGTDFALVHNQQVGADAKLVWTELVVI